MRKEMTEEQKKAAAERLKKAREAKKAKQEEEIKPKTNEISEEKATNDTIIENEVKQDETSENEPILTEEKGNTEKEDVIAQLIEQNKRLMEEMEAMKEKLENAESKPQVVQISTNTEKVQLLWQADVADDNVVTFGEHGMYGRITGKTGTIYVPKAEFSRVIDEITRHFLDKRWLMVISGLDESEREVLGVNYEEGELLDKFTFKNMVDLGEKMLEIYPNLCEGHKEIVASRFYEAWLDGSDKVNKELITKLNKLSANNSFKQMLLEMNEADMHEIEEY